MNPQDQNKEWDMSEFQLVYYPENICLEQPVIPFPENTQSQRRAIFEHMKEIMQKHRGVGLAANQINLNGSVHVQLLDDEIVPMFNPFVQNVSDRRVLMQEGCLSDPGLFLHVKRPDAVEVTWEDELGNLNERVLEGFAARIFLHEFDHLNGVLFIDRVGKVKLDRARKKQKKLLK